MLDQSMIASDYRAFQNFGFKTRSILEGNKPVHF